MNDVMYHGDKYKKIDVVGEKILIKKLKNWNDLVEKKNMELVKMTSSYMTIGRHLVIQRIQSSQMQKI